MRAEWEGKFDSVVDQWTEHCENAPTSDHVQEYLLSHPNKFHIPLRDYLFKGAGIELAPVAPIVPGTRSGLSKAKTNPSVTWSNRGQPTRRVIWSTFSLLRVKGLYSLSTSARVYECRIEGFPAFKS